MTVAYLYSQADGRFTGRRIEGDEAFCLSFADVGTGVHIGDIDWRRNRVDLETGNLVPCTPQRPADTADTLYTWDAVADDWKAAPTAAKLDRDARAKRAELLAASDWVTLRSTDTGQPIPAAWSAYRTALRNITDQPGYPNTINWPQAPT
jgi:hypothetical protein